jgi:hypothetical protein
MRTIRWLAPLSMVLASSLALAAPPDSGRTPKADVPPPPGLDDPGVATPAEKPADAAQPAAATADVPAADPLAPLPKPDTRLVRDRADRDPAAVAQRMAVSEKTTRRQGEDTVEEYRQNGKVWMIHIVPASGGPGEIFMDTTGTGRLTRDPKQGPVSPVYYSLYEWN